MIGDPGLARSNSTGRNALIRQRSGRRCVDSSPDSNLAAMPLAGDRRSGPDPAVDRPSWTLQQPLPGSTKQMVRWSRGQSHRPVKHTWRLLDECQVACSDDWMRFDLETKASPEQVLRALTDFTDARLQIWNRTLDPKTYELRDSGQTWAVARESSRR